MSADDRAKAERIADGQLEILNRPAACREAWDALLPSERSMVREVYVQQALRQIGGKP